MDRRSQPLAVERLTSNLVLTVHRAARVFEQNIYQDRLSTTRNKTCCLGVFVVMFVYCFMGFAPLGIVGFGSYLMCEFVIFSLKLL